MSVSMKPKYATLALAPCWTSSARSARPSCSTAAFLIAYAAAPTPLLHVEHALEALRRGGAQGGHARSDTRVRHHHVHGAEALDGGGHRALHRAAIGHVGGDARAAGIVNRAGGRSGRGLVQIHDRLRGP